MWGHRGDGGGGNFFKDFHQKFLQIIFQKVRKMIHVQSSQSLQAVCMSILTLLCTVNSICLKLVGSFPFLHFQTAHSEQAELGKLNDYYMWRSFLFYWFFNSCSVQRKFIIYFGKIFFNTKFTRRICLACDK